MNSIQQAWDGMTLFGAIFFGVLVLGLLGYLLSKRLNQRKVTRMETTRSLNVSNPRLALYLLLGLLASVAVSYVAVKHPRSYFPSIYYLMFGLVGTIVCTVNFNSSRQDVHEVLEHRVNGPVKVWTLAHERATVVRLTGFLAMVLLGGASIVVLALGVVIPPAWEQVVFTTCLIYPEFALGLNEVLDSTVPIRMRIARRIELEENARENAASQKKAARKAAANRKKRSR